MADFVAVIRKAVDNLSENTADNRVKVYDKARAAIRRQLEAISPKPSEDVITRQLEKLDVAIREVESEHAEALPAEEEDGGKTKRRRSKPRGKDPVDPPPPPPPAKPKRFRIDRSSAGFVIRPGDSNAATPSRLVVRAAYDLRRGNPFDKWNLADFRLASLATKCTDANLVEEDGNRMVFEILGPAFEIPFEGFDKRRDILIDVKAQEVADDAQV